MMDEVAVDGIQIYGPGTSANLILKDFKGLGNPPPRANRTDRARRHGAIDLTTYYSFRTWTGDMWISADGTDLSDWENFWTAYDIFMGAMDYGVPTKTLLFKRKGLSYEEFTEVTINDEMEPEFPAPSQPICKVPFSMVAADPRIYAATLETHIHYHRYRCEWRQLRHISPHQIQWSRHESWTPQRCTLHRE